MAILSAGGKSPEDGVAKPASNFKAKNLDCYVHVTRQCNQKCLFCSTPPISSAASFEALERRVGFFKKAIFENGGNGQVIFTGGEPTVYPRLPELVESAHNAGVQTKMITNGARLSDKSYLEKLASCGLGQVSVSLHSHDKRVSDRLTGVPGNFAKTVAGLENLETAGIGVLMGIVINSLNYRELAEYAEFVTGNFPFVRFVSLNFVDAVKEARKNKWIVPSLSQAEPFLYPALEIFEKRGVDFHVERVPLCYLHGFESHCSESNSLLGVDHYAVSRIEKNRCAVFLQDFKRDYLKAWQCGACSLEGACAGLDGHYAGLFGTKELFPQFRN